MPNKREKVAFPLYIDNQILKLIEKYQEKHYLRLPSRNAAVVELLLRGLTESFISDSTRFDKLLETLDEKPEKEKEEDAE